MQDPIDDVHGFGEYWLVWSLWCWSWVSGGLCPICHTLLISETRSGVGKVNWKL